jgi:hypothetical protein
MFPQHSSVFLVNADRIFDDGRTSVMGDKRTGLHHESVKEE